MKLFESVFNLKSLNRPIQCFHCNRDCIIVTHHPFVRLFWQSKIRFCPFCGCSLTDITEPELASAGYEKVADNEN